VTFIFWLSSDNISEVKLIESRVTLLPVTQFSVTVTLKRVIIFQRARFIISYQAQFCGKDSIELKVWKIIFYHKWKLIFQVK
jgi:hypothetical protein